MTISRTQAIIFAVIAIALLACGVFFGRSCSHTTPIVVPPTTGIDAGPGEAAIAATLDASLQHTQELLGNIERKHDDDIANFTAAQQAEYDRVRTGSLDDIVVYLNQHRHVGVDAGTT